MSFLQKFPIEFIDAVLWLVEKGQWNVLVTHNFSSPLVEPLLKEALKEGRSFAESVFGALRMLLDTETVVTDEESAYLTARFQVAAQLIATGHKSVRLSKEECIALEHAALPELSRDYRQPFNTMVVELPQGHGERKSVTTSASGYPTSVVLHHEPDNYLLMSAAVFSEDEVEQACVIYDPEESLEQVLQAMDMARSSGEGKYALSVNTVRATRIALNKAFQMAHGWEHVPLTKEQRQKRQGVLKHWHSKNTPHARRARRRLAALPTYIQLKK